MLELCCFVLLELEMLELEMLELDGQTGTSAVWTS